MIMTDRFYLRPLNLVDVTQEYQNWFFDAVTKNYISSAKTGVSLDSLREFIEERLNRNDVLFLGIFTRDENHHIGNIKYEPIDHESGFAEMGILIGDIQYRGKGVAREVILASAQYLNKMYSINRIYLGVDKTNESAIKAYIKTGFQPVASAEKFDESTKITRMLLTTEFRS